MSSLPITLEAIAVIDAIDKRGSYAAAAELLNKVPSALSYIVQKLEEQLQVTIFQKQGRRSVLTPAGKNLLKEGRLILQAVERMTIKTQTIANGWEPKLNIAIDSIVQSRTIFSLFSDFLLQHPSIEIDISEEVMNGGWESLVDDKIDMLIGAPQPIPKQKGIQTEYLCDFEPVFAVSPTHPLNQYKQPISDAIIAQYRAVIVHDSARNWVANTHAVISDDKYFYVPNIEYKVNAQLAGIGCGFLPRQRIQAYLNSGELIELQRERNRQPMPLYLAWKVVNQGKALKTIREMLIAKQEQLHC